MIATARTGRGVTRVSRANNDPVAAPAAYLIGDDPTGKSDVRIEHICVLSDENYQRYKAAERMLHDIVVANVLTYLQGLLKVFETVWKGASAALASNEIRPNTDPRGGNAVEHATPCRRALSVHVIRVPPGADLSGRESTPTRLRA